MAQHPDPEFRILSQIPSRMRKCGTEAGVERAVAAMAECLQRHAAGLASEDVPRGAGLRTCLPSSVEATTGRSFRLSLAALELVHSRVEVSTISIFIVF